MIITLDQAIYAKALEVVLKRSDEFKHVVLRLGSFHISCAFLAVLRRRFGDAGLMDVQVEAGVVGVSAVRGVVT